MSATDKQLLPNYSGSSFQWMSGGQITAMLAAYFAMVREKTKPEVPGSAQILQSAVIATKEAGELLDVANRLHYYEQPLEFVKDGQTHAETLLEECGDILFGVQGVLATQGLTLLDAMSYNLNKLAKRYKGGFSTEEAASRNDKVGLGSVPPLPQLDLPGVENPGLTD